jgi:hypothetical protein
MKRLALCLAGVVAVSVSMLAQRGGPPAPPPPLEPGASQADVDLALLAAPARLKDQAMVVKWKPDHTYTVLRKNGANNNLVCYDRSGFPLQQAFSIECTNIGNLERVKQNMTIEALGDRAKAQAAFDEAEKNGSRVKPEFGSVFYHIQGPDKDRANPHMTIAVPGATQASLGLPENGRGGGVWIMNAGTTTAHLMVPGE